MNKYIETSLDGSVAIVKMNRPPANAISLDFLSEFREVISEVSEDQTARVVVITSSIPGVFAAGADIKLMFKMDVRQVHSAVTDVFGSIQRLPKPVIAMINGHALGGGCELALCCDYRFMEKDKSKIGLPEVNLGIISAGGGTQRMSRLLGRAKATELLFEGTRIGAKEALDIGLVHRIFSAEDLSKQTLAYADRLASQSPVAIRLIKRCLNEGLDNDLDRGLELEGEALLEAFEAEDVREGVNAFIERRIPKF